MGVGSGFQVTNNAPVHYEAHVERFMAPFVRALVEAVVRQGDTVLDVACGTGFATRAAAAAVGTSGRVTGSDLNAAMVVMAQSIPTPLTADIDWHRASALDLPFGNGEFDTVICQQGLQFFPEPSAGLREMARVCRPGGRIAATVWSAVEDSPFLAAEFAIFGQYCDANPAEFLRTFISDGERRIAGWFESAELSNIRIERVEATVSLPPPAIYIPQHARALPWSGTFADLTESVRDEALASVDEALAQYRTSNGIDVPFVSYLATATT